MKPKTVYYGRLVGTLTVGKPATISTVGKMIHTGKVTRILVNEPVRLHFETAKRQYHVSLAPFGMAVSFKPVLLAANPPLKKCA